jgi:hypothetical protein
MNILITKHSESPTYNERHSTVMEPGGPERCSLGMLIMCDESYSPKTLNALLQSLDEKVYFR